MIQLNLLPDVKLQYIKAQQARRLIFSVSFLVSAASVGLLIIALLYDGLQHRNLTNLNKDIKNESSTLQNEPQINKILTVQNQLNSLTQLHTSKPAAASLFTYLNEVTPVQVAIGTLNADFNANTLSISGTSDNLKDINTFVDTIKYSKYSIAGTSGTVTAFSNVVLTSFGLNNQSPNPAQAASYTINLSFDPTIFNVSKTVNLIVPNIVTTRSELALPSDLSKITTNGGN